MTKELLQVSKNISIYISQAAKNRAAAGNTQYSHMQEKVTKILQLPFIHFFTKHVSASVLVFLTYFQPLSSMGTPPPHSPALIAHTPHKTEPDCFPFTPLLSLKCSRTERFSYPSLTDSSWLLPSPTFSLPYFLSFYYFHSLLFIWAHISYPSVGEEGSLQSARPPFLSMPPSLCSPLLRLSAPSVQVRHVLFPPPPFSIERMPKTFFPGLEWKRHCHQMGLAAGVEGRREGKGRARGEKGRQRVKSWLRESRNGLRHKLSNPHRPYCVN